MIALVADSLDVHSRGVNVYVRCVVCLLLLSSLVDGPSAGVAVGHPGGVDAAGGHVDKSTGRYHFHSAGGSTVDQATNMPANVKQPTSSTASAEQKRRAMREHAAKALMKAALNSKRKAMALRSVAELFPETAAGGRAKRAADRIDPDGGKTAPEIDDDEAFAATRYEVARQLFLLGHNEMAVHVLEELVATYPDTKAAEQAQTKLNAAATVESIDLPDGGFFDHLDGEPKK